MTCGSEYTAQLHASGFRMTPQRLAILHVLHHAGTHLSPTAIYEKARRDAPGLTEATVYRTLEFLERNGWATCSQGESRKPVYEISRKRHHHAVCRSCGASLEIQPGLLDVMLRRLERSSGYRFPNSHVVFRGVCPACQRRNLTKGDQ